MLDSFDGVAELKAPLIVLFVGDEPLAWIDDDLTPRLERWATRRDQRIPTLLVKRNPKIGLTVLYRQELIRFVHRVQVWREKLGSRPVTTNDA